MGKQLVSSLLASADGGGGGGGNRHWEFPPEGTRCGSRGWSGPEVPSSPIYRWRLCNPQCENNIWGFRGAPPAGVTRPPGSSTGGNASGWIPPPPPPASQPASSPHRAFHLGGLWPPWAVGEEAESCHRERHPKHTQRPAAGEEAGPRAGLSGAARAAPAQGGAFGLSGLRRAPRPPVTGAHTGTGQSLPGGFGRGSLTEDAAGRGGDGPGCSSRDGPESAATSVVRFSVSF